MTLTTRNGHDAAVRVMLVAPPLMAWGLERLLQSAEPELHCLGVVGSVLQGLPHLGSCRPDVVVLDLDGEDGPDCVAQLHAHSPAKVIAITGSNDPQVHDGAVLAGARGVVTKRESPPVLLKAIEKVHQGELWVDRQATGRLFLELARQKVRQGSDPERSRIDTLTARERQMVGLLVQQAASPAKVIAQQLHISEHTLRNHLSSIYAKLSVASRVELHAFAMRHGLQG